MRHRLVLYDGGHRKRSKGRERRRKGHCLDIDSTPCAGSCIKREGACSGESQVSLWGALKCSGHVGTSSLQPRTEGVGRRWYLFGEPRLRESVRKIGVSPTARARRLLVRDAVRAMTRRLALVSLSAIRWSSYYFVICLGSKQQHDSVLHQWVRSNTGQICQNASLIW